MIEVFKTNVNDKATATMLVAEIEKHFKGFLANFDLEDCDNILRINNPNGLVCPSDIVNLLELYGYDASVLEDILICTA